MLRCLKNENGVIIAMGTDQGQSGADENMGGTWCDWVIEESELPAALPIEGEEIGALRFKENLAEDGIELRTDEEVLESPLG